VEASAVVVLTLCLGTMLSGWWIFQHVRLERPPLGTISLADVGIMIGAVVLVPLLYLALPSFMISGLLLVAAASSVHTLFSALLDSKRAVWSIVGLAMVADVACDVCLGPRHPAFVLINNPLLLALAGTAAALWVQGGLRARHAAVLTCAVAVYDLLATGLLPLTDALIARLASTPMSPLLQWDLASVGLGDVLILTLVPLAFHKAFSETAGLIAMTTGILGIAACLVFHANGPLMTGLGPILAFEYLAFRYWHGPERSTWQYLSEKHHYHRFRTFPLQLQTERW
jgi:hypothetical protein